MYRQVQYDEFWPLIQNVELQINIILAGSVKYSTGVTFSTDVLVLLIQMLHLHIILYLVQIKCNV